jgi:hypothetical protein
MPVEVGYLTISVADTEKAERFYGELFGWQFRPGSSGQGYAHIGNTKLPMGVVPNGSDAPPTLYFRVDDLEAALAKVEALGGKAGAITESKSGRGAECRDDQGAIVHLWEPAPGF